eukprot:6908714-Prymnesium_polylepis.1
MPEDGATVSWLQRKTSRVLAPRASTPPPGEPPVAALPSSLLSRKLTRLRSGGAHDGASGR